MIISRIIWPYRAQLSHENPEFLEVFPDLTPHPARDVHAVFVCSKPTHVPKHSPHRAKGNLAMNPGPSTIVPDMKKCPHRRALERARFGAADTTAQASERR